MLIQEILYENRAIILEYGRKGFPGFGAALFSQRYYEYMVGEINQVADQHARQWLTDWMSEAFARDNPKFKPDLFKRAIADGKVYQAAPMFQQRHFYYLAHLVKQITDPHIHQFARDWLADVAGDTNGQFKRAVWDKFCASDTHAPPDSGPALTDPQDHPADSKPRGGQMGSQRDAMDEGYGGAPGFGSRSHGGFGQKFFRRSHYQFIAWQLHHLSDPAIRDHLTAWFVKLFKLDNPSFKAEDFEQAVMSSPTYSYHRPNAVFQQRHFYYLAHEVAEIADKHEREFVCDWLASHVGRTNEYFNDERWREYCHLGDETWARKQVRHTRAKARGDKDIPESPWQERKRAEREKATILTPEEFHAQASCYAEAKGELKGHDLVYLRMANGDFEVYDKTTNEHHWAVDGPDHYEGLAESLSSGTAGRGDKTATMEAKKPKDSYFKVSDRMVIIKHDPMQAVNAWNYKVYDRWAHVITRGDGYPSENAARAAAQDWLKAHASEADAAV